MSAEHYIKTLCPLCDGAIEFPADALGQRADCPHCHKTFVLGSVTAPAQTEEVPSTLNQPPSALNQMNVNQKILTGVALLAFLISVCIAPWEVTAISTSYQNHSILGKTTVYSPVWEQPNGNILPYYGEDHRYECRLLWSPLLGVWIAIGVLYTGSFFLLKNTPSILEKIKPLIAQKAAFKISRAEFSGIIQGLIAVFCMLIAVASIGAGFYLVFIDETSEDRIAKGFSCCALAIVCVFATIALCKSSQKNK